MRKEFRSFSQNGMIFADVVDCVHIEGDGVTGL